MSPFARRLRQTAQFAPVSNAWPNATNTGLLGVTTQTLPGAAIYDFDYLNTHGFTSGSGTHNDPYLIDRVLFTDIVVLGNGAVSDLTGLWVKFTNCRFYGNPGNPTPSNSRCILARPNGAHFIVEDSTIGPNATMLPSGGPPANIGGCDKGILSYVPFEVRRCNIFGSNVQVGMETDLGVGTYTIIEDNYCHDTWAAPGDHTDTINGNLHASRVKIIHNYLDGHRTDDTFVTNGIGWYDDPAGPTGRWEDLTIDNNYITRSATVVLMTNDTARALDPLIVTNNVFNTIGATNTYIGRSPSTQSNNVDENGSPLVF